MEHREIERAAGSEQGMEIMGDGKVISDCGIRIVELKKTKDKRQSRSFYCLLFSIHYLPLTSSTI